jgi:hypothetical protein
LFLGVIFSVTSYAWADYSEEQAKQMEEDIKKLGFKTMTTKEGLNFNIPADMPVVTRNGLTSPVNFDEYLYVKYRQLQDELKQMGTKLDGLSDKLDRILKVVDEKTKALEAAPTTENARAL